MNHQNQYKLFTMDSNRAQDSAKERSDPKLQILTTYNYDPKILKKKFINLKTSNGSSQPKYQNKKELPKIFKHLPITSTNKSKLPLMTTSKKTMNSVNDKTKKPFQLNEPRKEGSKLETLTYFLKANQQTTYKIPMMSSSRLQHTVVDPMNQTYHLQQKIQRNIYLEQITFDKDINLKKYKIEQLLGKGSYAQVYKCRKDNELFAVKTYELKKIQAPYKINNLKREIENLRVLDHSNISKLLACTKDHRSISLIFKYEPSQTLRSYMLKQHQFRVPEPIAKKIFVQVLSAISYCHSQGIVHRDLKPDNLLIDKSFNVTLIDFGFSCKVQENVRQSMACGTPQFMSPQIAQKQTYCGKKADVWSLGVLLFMMLHGKYPFSGYNERELYSNISLCNISGYNLIRKDLKEFLDLCLQIDENERSDAELLINSPYLQGI